jgi:mRNA-degrading endonuclease YafQ of YafQ-DinJ toxin-antitoxin module
MSYFIFTSNSDNENGTLYRIAENTSDLNNLNINKLDYKIIEDSQINFDTVKYGTKIILKYNNDNIIYENATPSFLKIEKIIQYVEMFKKQIKQFTENNQNHPLFSRWNNYYDQLNSLNLNTITYPLNKSLEQYFFDLGQPSYNILQIP